jgi:hypothetical protein
MNYKEKGGRLNMKGKIYPQAKFSASEGSIAKRKRYGRSSNDLSGMKAWHIK